MRQFGYGRVSNWERKVKSINLSVLDFVWENRSLMEFWLGSSKSQIFGMFLKRRWLRNLYFLQICCTLLKFAGRNCRSVKVFDIWSRCKVLPGPAVKACCFQFTEQSSQDLSHHHHHHHYHQHGHQCRYFSDYRQGWHALMSRWSTIYPVQNESEHKNLAKGSLVFRQTVLSLGVQMVKYSTIESHVFLMIINS